MSEIDPQVITEVLASCKAGAAESSAIIARTFQREIQISVADQDQWQSSATSLELEGPGLIVLLKTDRETVVLTIPAAHGLAPTWCAAPDASGESRLATMAQELGMNLLPETWFAHEFRATWVESLGEALRRGGLPPDATVITLLASQAGQPAGKIGLIWPVESPERLFAAGQSELPSTDLTGQSVGKKQPAPSHASRDLPPYTRSLLRIKVPIVVTLAEKRQRLSRIIELGPGAIIQFDKSCEEMLNLEVGNRYVASGEAVKVGDKFGLRITAIALPDERFDPVQPSSC
jgi:flagellar motor switch/type III secretory pathway protein FliN